MRLPDEVRDKISGTTLYARDSENDWLTSTVMTCDLQDSLKYDIT